jgi:hypothetical protein
MVADFQFHVKREILNETVSGTRIFLDQKMFFRHKKLLSHRPIVLLESGIFFRACRYLCHQVPDRFTAFSIF